MKARTEHDGMGDIEIPAGALWGPQTQRAFDHFQISDQTLPEPFIQAIALIKAGAAQVNMELGLLDPDRAEAITAVALQIATGDYMDQFPLDVFQTGSGTSTHMNVNEVVARLASQQSGLPVRANDHVNLGQSSNDIMPSAIHLCCTQMITDELIPALDELASCIENKAREFAHVIKTGRTHLMDAMPLSIGQEFGAWAAQVRSGSERIEATLHRVYSLTIGGTAVGTGVNTHPLFAERVIDWLNEETGLPFTTTNNHFAQQSAQDHLVELSGQLKTLAVSLMKIGNDLRWMNSGPNEGLAEIRLAVLQQGSSIMPGKVNPVIPEAVCMVCAQVIGLDVANTVAGQSGNFQLNVMLPLLATNLVQMIQLLANSAHSLAELSIQELEVQEIALGEKIKHNPMLATVLSPLVGYELSAHIAKRAQSEGRTVMDIALEETNLDENELEVLLDPERMIGQ